MTARNICFVTGSRAEYGLLYWPMKAVAADPSFALQVVVTGSHLSKKFGDTWREIERDGFAIDAKVDMALTGDTAESIGISMGIGAMGFARAFARLRPDLVVLLGDRFELLGAAGAALVARIPVAHLCGGDVTEGAYDDALRHALTKLSHLHFPSNREAARRIAQMGEDPARIFMVGSPGLDHLTRTPRLSREELAQDLGFEFREKNLLVTYHPVTLDAAGPSAGMGELLAALDRLGPRVGIVFTLPNADNDNAALFRAVEAFVATHPNAKSFASLGQLRYLSLVAQVDAVAGNSSSGLYEVPSFGKPTVNIGDRQKGRLKAPSVLDCPAQADAVEAALRRAFALDCRDVVNPYGDGQASERIVACLKRFDDFRVLLRKPFHSPAPEPT